MTFPSLRLPLAVRKIGRKWIKGYLRDFVWHLYGMHLHHQPMDLRHDRSLLFICKGNICRSPFAHLMAAKLLGNKNATTVCSSGLHVKKSIAPPALAVEAAARFGIDLDRHRSKQIDLLQVEQADLVFAMEVWQWRMLRRQFPAHRHKMVLMALVNSGQPHYQYGFERSNISDPYGKDISEFIRCYQRITDILTAMSNKSTMSDVTTQE